MGRWSGRESRRRVEWTRSEVKVQRRPSVRGDLCRYPVATWQIEGPAHFALCGPDSSWIVLYVQDLAVSYRKSSVVLDAPKSVQPEHVESIIEATTSRKFP